MGPQARGVGPSGILLAYEQMFMRLGGAGAGWLELTSVVKKSQGGNKVGYYPLCPFPQALPSLAFQCALH